MKRLLLFIFLIPLLTFAQPKQVTSNSSNALLGSSATFSGTLETVPAGYNWLLVTVRANKSSATDGLKVYWAKDSKNSPTYTTIDKRSYTASDSTNGANVYLFKVAGSYFKVKYTNTNSAQTGTASITTYLLDNMIPTGSDGSVPVSIVGSAGSALATELTQTDNKTALQAIQKRLQQTRPSGLSYYSNLAGDFTATPVSGTNKIAITGLAMTVDHKDVVYGAYKRLAGDWTYLGAEPFLGTNDTIYYNSMSGTFLSTDQVDIVFVGATQTQDKVLDLVKTNEQSPNWARYIQESIEDVTNLAAGTAYYPSSTGASMDGYKSLSLTGTLVDANDTSWVYLEATNDEDQTNANWIQVYGFETKTNSALNVITANNTTTTFAWDFTDFNYAYYRVKVVTGDATNTVIIKSRKVY